jgi:hypothetical protein
VDKEFEEFIRFRCKEIILDMGINPDTVNIDACVRCYKAGARSMMKIAATDKTNMK